MLRFLLSPHCLPSFRLLAFAVGAGLLIPLPVAAVECPEMLVLLADSPGAPTPEAVVEASALGAALPAPLDLGNVSGARYMIAERPSSEPAARIVRPGSPGDLLLRYLVLSYPEGSDLDAIRSSLMADPRVLYVSRSQPIHLSPVTPSDPLFPQQWGFPALHLPDGWDRSRGHAYVGVVDTGIDTTHPDLRAFDDFGGYLGGNFATRLARDFGYDEDNVDEGEPQVEDGQVRQVGRAGHGTHVAGTIAATTDNQGVASACHHCSLIVAKVSRLTDQFSPGEWRNIDQCTENVIAGIKGAVDRGAQLINMSFGQRSFNSACFTDCAAEPFDPYCQALEYAADRDVVMIGASGNDGDDDIDFPALDPRVIAAGGIESSGQFWDDCSGPPPFSCAGRDCGSNHGPDQFVAPAKDVISTFYRGIPYAPDDCTEDLPATPGYGPCSGTSMATPHLTGSLGILRSLNPLLDRADLEGVLLANLDNPPGWNPLHGYGKPDFAAAADVVLGTSDGSVLPNRLTPLFTAYSPQAETHFYSAAPQMMTAAFFDLEVPAAPAEGSPTPLYGAFPWTCTVSPCPSLPPTASAYLFTTQTSPFGGALPLVPLFRMGFDEPFGGNPLNRSFFYTTEALGLEVGRGLGYELDGREGYIFERCTPEPSCIPAGAERLYRYYHAGRDDYAIFPESELPIFTGQGYTAPTGLQPYIGYVYLNVDADGDGLIDGFETVAGTDPGVADSDCDGIDDGVEVIEFPYGDPLDGDCSEPIFIVTSAGDGADTNPGDGFCLAAGGGCTLRAAIQESNTSPGQDLIEFAIPGGNTIQPTSLLPVIIDPVVIDGLTQSPQELVEIDGSLAGADKHGLRIAAPGGNEIRGLVINRFSRAGIRISGGGGNQVYQNRIGTDQSGQVALGNSWAGIQITNSANNQIGAFGPGGGNLLSGNQWGVRLSGAGSTGNLVFGNLIGTDLSGTGALGNTVNGIRIDSGASGNTISDGMPRNVVDPDAIGNTIAYNGQDGIAILDGNSAQNDIFGNSIFANGGLGIDLGDDGVTPNDPDDTDAGPNNLQNFPVINDVTVCHNFNTTTVNGSLDLPAQIGKFLIDVYVGVTCDPTQHGEGEQHLKPYDSFETFADGSWSIRFPETLGTGQMVTVTATLAGSTSELSECEVVPSPPIHPCERDE